MIEPQPTLPRAVATNTSEAISPTKIDSVRPAIQAPVPLGHWRALTYGPPEAHVPVCRRWTSESSNTASAASVKTPATTLAITRPGWGRGPASWGASGSDGDSGSVNELV